MIAAIFVCALVIRLVGARFGLPRLYLPDEEFFVGPALQLANSGGFDPGWYGAPAQPLIYGLAFIFRGLNFLVNQLKDTADPVVLNYETNIVLFQTAGRLLSIVAGARLSVMVFLLGRRWSNLAGDFGAGLVVTSFFLIEPPE